MKYNLFILTMAFISMSVIFLLSGCCSMPLVDCGPRRKGEDSEMGVKK